MSARRMLQILSISAETASAWPRIESRQSGLGIFRGNGCRTVFSPALRDGLGMSRNPDARAIDAAAAAVDEDAVGHDVEILGPVVDFVVAQDDLAEARAVRLHARVSLVLLDGGGAAEDQAPLTVGQHGSADVAKSGIDGDSLFGNAGLAKGLGHAIGRPRFLRPRLEHESNLQWNDWQPERVHTW